MKSSIRFFSFPVTEPPPHFVAEVVTAFRAHEALISTTTRGKGLTSDHVLSELRADLESIGFLVEGGKLKAQKIHRPVFFGENGAPSVRYEIDAYHSLWRCGLEIEAGRGWLGNAVYRDLILASLMADVDHLILAVANAYKYNTGGKPAINKDYDYATALASTIFAHARIKLPYKLTVIGY